MSMANNFFGSVISESRQQHSTGNDPYHEILGLAKCHINNKS